MNIRVEIKNVYGEDKVYPKCHRASLFSHIAGTKTLTRSTLCYIIGLGVQIDVLDRYGNVSATFGAGNDAALPVTIR